MYLAIRKWYSCSDTQDGQGSVPSCGMNSFSRPANEDGYIRAKLQEELWGWAAALTNTADFALRTGLTIWTGLANAEEAEEGWSHVMTFVALRPLPGCPAPFGKTARVGDYKIEKNKKTKTMKNNREKKNKKILVLFNARILVIKKWHLCERCVGDI